MSGDVLTRNVKIIAEGLARHIFNMTESNTVNEIHDLICSTQIALSPSPSLPFSLFLPSFSLSSTCSLRLRMAFMMYTRTSCGRG